MIEADARRFIIDAIQAESDLSTAEKGSSLRLIDDAQETLIRAICSINAVANFEGKGRDDFTAKTIQGADRFLKNEEKRSRATIQMAQNVKTSFNAFRVLGRKYRQNVQMVDP